MQCAGIDNEAGAARVPVWTRHRFSTSTTEVTASEHPESWATGGAGILDHAQPARQEFIVVAVAPGA